MVEYTCDGCGKKQAVFSTRGGDFLKPRDWFVRTDDDGTQVACSRECIKVIAEKTGKTSVILPI